MTGWQHGILTGLVNFALVLATLKILIDLLGTWLSEPQQKHFRTFLEEWQREFHERRTDVLFKSPLSALSKVYEGVLGTHPFSRQSFFRTCIFGTLFLGACLGFAGLLYGKPFAMDIPPWKSFLLSADFLHHFATNPSIKQQVGDPLYMAKNAADLARLGSWPYAVAFTLYFAVIVVLLVAFLFSISVGVSRLFLREMIEARTFFRIFVLHLSSVILLLTLGTATSLILFVLLNIWTWPFLPLFFALSKSSLALGTGLAYAASVCSWSFSALWLRIVVILALLPSIIVAFVMGVTTIAFLFRRRFHEVGGFLIRKSLQSPRGIFSFISASTAALTFLLTLLASLTAWLANFSLKLGTPTFFGFDSLGFAILLLLVLLGRSFARAKTAYPNENGYLLTQKVLFLFFGTLVLTIFGFYIQAICECLISQPAWSLQTSNNTILPAVAALIPGCVSAYCVVCVKLQNNWWGKAAFFIFLVLTIDDVFGTVRGLSPYSDLTTSTLCNILGGIVAAFVIFTSHSFLFRRRI